MSFKDGDAVKITNTEHFLNVGKTGTVVACIGRRYKVLLNEDTGRSKDPLQYAKWFFDLELELAEEGETHQ